MSHVDEGCLHAYLDGALEADVEREDVERHLRACTRCRARLEIARADRDSAGEVLEVLEPASLDGPPFEEIEARRSEGGDASGTGAGPGTAGAGLGGGSPGTWVRSRERLAWAATVVIALGGGWIGHGAWSSLSGPEVGQAGAPAVRLDSMRAPTPEEMEGATRSMAEPAAAESGAAEPATSASAEAEDVATGAQGEDATAAGGDAGGQAGDGEADGAEGVRGAGGDAGRAMTAERSLADARDRARGAAGDRDDLQAEEETHAGAAQRTDAGGVERGEVTLQGAIIEDEDAEARAGSVTVAAARAQKLLDTLASNHGVSEAEVRNARALEAADIHEWRDTTLQGREQLRTAVTSQVAGDVPNAPASHVSITALRSALRTLESREEAADSRSEWMSISPAQAAEHLRTAPLDLGGFAWVTMEVAADRGVPLLRSRYPLPGGEVVELLQAPAPVGFPVAEAERAAAPVAGDGGLDFFPVPVPEGGPSQVVAHFADQDLTVILRGPVPVDVLEVLLGRLR